MPTTTPPPSAESDPSGEGMDTSTPHLFTQNGMETYASATSDSSECSTASETDKDLCVLRENATWRRGILGGIKGQQRPQTSDPPSGSDEEQEAPSKKSMASETPSPPHNEENKEENNESSQLEENDPSEPATPTQQEPATPSSAGLHHFIAALTSTGWQKSALMQAIPGERHYYCRGIFLQHKQGDISNVNARSHTKNDKEKTA